MHTNYGSEDISTNTKEDIDDPELYKDFQLFETPVSAPTTQKATSKSIKQKVDAVELESKFKVGTALCFVKISSFEKQVIGESLHAILNLMDVELLGLKIVHAKKELYFGNVPEEVQRTIKSVAFKFHELATDLKMRKKMLEFSCLMLVLRGQNVEG